MFSFSIDETITGWASVTTTIDSFINLTPSGTAGSQIVSASWSNTAPVWVDSKNGWYVTAGSNVRVIGKATCIGTAQREKIIFNAAVGNGLYHKSAAKNGTGIEIQQSGSFAKGVNIEQSAASTTAVSIISSGQNSYGVYAYNEGNSGIGLYGYSINGNGLKAYSTFEYGAYIEGNGGTYSKSLITGYSGIYGVNAVGGNGVEGIGPSGGYDFYASGTGTNYGPFTGGHEVKLESNDCIQGMLLACTGEVHKRDGSISSTLPCVKKSSVANDKAIFGVFNSIVPLFDGHWYTPKPGEQFATCNALGEGRVLVTDINGELKLGDYITTSTVEGYGQRQDDDLLHSYTLGKVTETVDWNSVKKGASGYKEYLIACVYVSA